MKNICAMRSVFPRKQGFYMHHWKVISVKEKEMSKLRIWGALIPYNEPEKCKADYMILNNKSKLQVEMDWVTDVFGTSVSEDASGMDTFTWLDEISSGKASEYFDDVPTLTPYLVDGVDTAVIIAPGGGFCNQSREKEGYEIAEFLNKNGISAFVLEYRMNPYEAPVCYLDMQRAIRYVRYHATEYGLRRDHIGAMGFSAGGYVAGASVILLRDEVPVWKDYTPDDIDRESGRADFLGMIYPVAAFDRNPNMLCVLAGDAFFDPAKRPALQKKYSLTENITPDCPPQFLCYGDQDPLLDIPAYARMLDEAGVLHQTCLVNGASHGYGLRDEQFAYWGEIYVQWIRTITADVAANAFSNRVTAFAMAAMPAMSDMVETGVTSQLRVPVNVSGSSLIFRFSNQFGRTAGVIDHAVAAVTKINGQTVTPVFHDLRHKGMQRIVIPDGEEIESDPIPIAVEPGMEILVQVYCKDVAQTVCGVGYLTRTAEMRGTDQTGTECLLTPYSDEWERMYNQAQVQNISYLKAVDVICTDKPSEHVVLSCFGDSITAQNRWVWPLTRLLYKKYPGRISVLNFGIGGNRMLSDADSRMPIFGPAGIKRVAWDSYRDYGVRHMICALGGNDIGMGSFAEDGSFRPSPADYREGCRQFVADAHARGIKVYALSIYPGCWNEQDPVPRNRIRLQYLTIQREEFDGYIDIEEALKEEICGYKSGYGYDDNCHLRESGGEVVAKEVYDFIKPLI